jgi:hypothetical protein
MIGKIAETVAPKGGADTSKGNGHATASPRETIQARLWDEWDVILTERELESEMADDLD